MTRSTGDQRVDLLRVAAQRDHRVAHRREVDHRRHAGEVLHQDARRAEGDLLVGVRASGASRRIASMSSTRDAAAVLEAQQVLEQHLERERQPATGRPSAFSASGEREVVVAEIADLQRAADPSMSWPETGNGVS